MLSHNSIILGKINLKYFNKFRLNKWIGFIVLIAIWELLPRLLSTHSDVFPPFFTIIRCVIDNFGNYINHATLTFYYASIGFLIGNIIGIVFGVLFLLLPKLEKISLTFFTSIFSIPIICFSPIAGVIFDSKTGGSQIFLAVLAVFYPSILYCTLGLRIFDNKLQKITLIYGEAKFRSLWYIRLCAALPSITSALKISVPVAVLGAMIGDLSGAQKGLGYILFTSMNRAEGLEIWSISMFTIFWVAVFYYFFHFLTLIFSNLVNVETIDENKPFEKYEEIEGTTTPLIKKLIWESVAVTFTLFLWGLISFILNDFTVKGPIDVFNFLILDGKFPNENLMKLLKALITTLPILFWGFLISVLSAFVLAIISIIWRSIINLITPIILITQTIPLYSLVAIMYLVFGRGEIATFFIVISVTFLPAYNIMCFGFESMPIKLLELFRIYGSGKIKEFRFLRFPYSIPHIMAALRLILPKAFQGIVIAEYLIVGGGLGYELTSARGRLDFKMVWSICLIIVIVSHLLNIFLKVGEHIIYKYKD